MNWTLQKDGSWKGRDGIIRAVVTEHPTYGGWDFKLCFVGPPYLNHRCVESRLYYTHDSGAKLAVERWIKAVRMPLLGVGSQSKRRRT